MDDDDGHTGLLVIGVGNRDRGDDGAGPAVCDLVGRRSPEVRICVIEGSVLDLPMRWSADDAVVIVDAAAPAGCPGRRTDIDAIADRLVGPAAISTHSIDVGAAIELARALGRLPRRLTIIAIEAASDEHGAPLSSAVARTVATVAEELASRVSRRATDRAAVRSPSATTEAATG